jgi:hypothetical protein
MATTLWVIGTTRSGTSWVYDLVASHPDVSFGYEAKLPVEGIPVYNRWAPRLTDTLAMAGLLEDLRLSVPDDANVSWTEGVYLQSDLPERLLEAHNANPGWATVCEHIFRSQEGTSHWGNKMLRIELTPVLEEHWPDSRFLVLTRDPRAVLASQEEKFDHTTEYSAMYWLTHASWVEDRLGDNPNYRVVDIVEMAANPEPHLEWLFSEAGLSTEPIKDVVSRFPGDPDRLDSWRGSLDPKHQRRMEAYCFNRMKALGYEPEMATEPRTLHAHQKVWAQVRTYGGQIMSDPGAITRKQVFRRFADSLRGSDTA